MAVRKTTKAAEAAIENVEAKKTAPEKAVKKTEEKAAKKAEEKPVKNTAPKKEVKETDEKPVKKAEAKAVKKEAKPAAPKKAPAKRAAKKAEANVTVFVEYGGHKIVAKEVLAAAKADFAVKNPDTVIETVELYVKPEEGVAYYVVNGVGSDDYKVML